MKRRTVCSTASGRGLAGTGRPGHRHEFAGVDPTRQALRSRLSLLPPLAIRSVRTVRKRTCRGSIPAVASRLIPVECVILTHCSVVGNWGLPCGGGAEGCGGRSPRHRRGGRIRSARNVVDPPPRIARDMSQLGV